MDASALLCAVRPIRYGWAPFACYVLSILLQGGLGILDADVHNKAILMKKNSTNVSKYVYFLKKHNHFLGSPYNFLKMTTFSKISTT